MAKPQYGHEHRKARKQALETFVDGTPCPICHKPMRVWQKLHLDHVIPVALGGKDGPVRLTHATCNDSDGAKLGAALRRRGLRRTRNPGRKQRRKLPKW